MSRYAAGTPPLRALAASLAAPLRNLFPRLHSSHAGGRLAFTAYFLRKRWDGLQKMCNRRVLHLSIYGPFRRQDFVKPWYNFWQIWDLFHFLSVLQPLREFYLPQFQDSL